MPSQGKCSLERHQRSTTDMAAAASQARPNLAAGPRRARRRDPRATARAYRFGAGSSTRTGFSGCRGRHAHRVGRPRIRNVGPHASAKAGRRRPVISEVARRCAQSGCWPVSGRVDARDRGDRLPPRDWRRLRSIVRSSDGIVRHPKRFAARGVKAGLRSSEICIHISDRSRGRWPRQQVCPP